MTKSIPQSAKAIVIGGGINSLISAALLSKKNKSVLLFESCEQIGGMASLNEFSPGFKCNLIYDYIKWIDDRVIKNFFSRSSFISFLMSFSLISN